MVGGCLVVKNKIHIFHCVIRSSVDLCHLVLPGVFLSLFPSRYHGVVDNSYYIVLIRYDSFKMLEHSHFCNDFIIWSYLFCLVKTWSSSKINLFLHGFAVFTQILKYYIPYIVL